MGGEATFAEIAQRDAREWAVRMEAHLAQAEALLAEAQAIAGAIEAKVGVASPHGLAPTYPGLTGPVLAVLRAPELRAALARWRSLRGRI